MMETRPTERNAQAERFDHFINTMAKTYAEEFVKRGKDISSRFEEAVANFIQDIEIPMQPSSQKKLRKITVVYDPDGDANSLDYVEVSASPEDDEQGANDNIALLLAAAKILTKTCPGVDESVYGTDLLGLTEDYMAGLVLKTILGGNNYGC